MWDLVFTNWQFARLHRSISVSPANYHSTSYSTSINHLMIDAITVLIWQCDGSECPNLLQFSLDAAALFRHFRRSGWFQICYVPGLCPSSGSLPTRKHDEECRLLGCDTMSQSGSKRLTLSFSHWDFFPEDGGDMFLRNVGFNKAHTAPHPRRRNSA
jgi:hypothetical protein